MIDSDSTDPRLSAFLSARAGDTAGMPTVADVVDALGASRRRPTNGRQIGALALVAALLTVAVATVVFVAGGSRQAPRLSVVPPSVPAAADLPGNGWIAYATKNVAARTSS